MKKTIPLAERLKQRAERENGIIQDQMKEQLATLRSELHVIMQRELNTIRDDIERQSRSFGWRILKSRLLWPCLAGLSLSVGIWAGSWGMMHYLSHQIRTMEQTIQTLQSQGGKIKLNRCGERLCVQTDETAPIYQDGYRILKGE